MAIGKKKKKARGNGVAPPPSGTTIIVRPQGNQIAFLIDGTPVTDYANSAGTTQLNPRAFTTVLSVLADVNIGGNTYHNVACHRVRASLMVGGVAKGFQFEVVDGVPSWYLDGVEYVPDSDFGLIDWNDDLTNLFAGGPMMYAWVRVQIAGGNPDWADYSASSVTIQLA